MQLLPRSLREVDQIRVERALAELRSGRLVLIESSATCALAIGVEHLNRPRCAELDEIATEQARLVLSPARLRSLGLDREQAGTVPLPVVDWTRIKCLALAVESRIDGPVSAAAAVDDEALELTRLALMLPAALVIPVPVPCNLTAAVVRTSGAAIRAFRTSRLRGVAIVGRARVPLEGARDAEFVVFRGGEGLGEQIAIIIGQPDLAKPIAVRLHSACLTGDLFGSLRCDCGDQLRDSVRRMAENDGGILLYLDQEGRGNGIANKIRAYRIQSQGYDTYEADEALGFEPDGRRFDFAAEMLRQLGVRRVRIITNNPGKTSALRNAGLEVVSEERILGRLTAENARYLASKRERAGHVIDLDLPALLVARD